MGSLGQENTACCWLFRPLISSNQTMARWPSPRLIRNLLPIWHKSKSQLITRCNWDPWLILTPFITKHRPRRKPNESALSPRRHHSSSPHSRTRLSLANPSYSHSTPLNQYGRSPRSASLHQKTTRYRRTRSSFSPCPRPSGRPVFVRRRTRFDRLSWNLMEFHRSGNRDRRT